MLFYPLSALINAITSTIVCVLAITKDPKSKINRAFSYFAFNVAFWSYCYFLWQISKDANVALFWCRALMAFAIFIPPTFLHFSVTLIKQREKYLNKIIFWYWVSAIFFILDFTPLFVKDVRPRMVFPFWPTPGITYAPFIVMFIALAVYSHILMFRHWKKFSGFERNQIKYISLGTAIGFLGGTTNYPLWYDIKILPIGNILVSVYVLLVFYAIIKFQLMDINLFITRAGIFSVVYALVLGIPFYVMILAKGFIERFGYYGMLIPLSMGMVLASAGPFIYLFVRRRAENILLKGQRRYQRALRELSKTMTLVKDLDRLLKLIVYRVSGVIKIEFACIYLAGDSQSVFIQKYPYSTIGFFPNFAKEIPFDSELISFIRQKRKAVVAEELTVNIKKQFNLKTGLIIPFFVKEHFLGFIVLGPKSQGSAYSQEDVSIFEVLANHAALAIENAEFIQESQKTQAQLFATERMTSMGAMAGGMSHQLNNRFHAISMATSDTIDTLKFIDTSSCSEEVKQYLADVKHALTRIQENAKHGGKIVNDFLNLSQPDRAQKESKEFALKEPLERAIEMVKIKTAFPYEIIEKEIQENLPNIEGDFVLLQDSFFNLIDNAIDALTKKESAIQNKQLPGLPMYKGNIAIRMYKSDSSIIVEIQDNGIGMTEDVKAKVFAPFFTTKATAVKGAGMGLFVIQKIINAHQGEIKVSSEYGQGTTFTITLPITQKKG